MTETAKLSKEEFVRETTDKVITMLQGAYLAAVSEGMTHEYLAQRMEVDGDTLENMIMGKVVLTLRDISDLSFHMGYTPHVELSPAQKL